MATPEKLNIWDRIFNRKRKEIHNRGSEAWFTYNYRYSHKESYSREYVEYKIIDRVTGSETIEKEYLN